MEIKLTDEQVEKATQVAYKTINPGGDWPKRAWKPEWNEAMLAAAPFLQCPIAEPTKEEVDAMERSYWKEGVDTDGPSARERMLREFVARRNSALTSKPDPRKQAIVALINGYIDGDDTEEQCADKILAALDEVSK